MGASGRKAVLAPSEGFRWRGAKTQGLRVPLSSWQCVSAAFISSAGLCPGTAIIAEKSIITPVSFPGNSSKEQKTDEKSCRRMQCPCMQNTQTHGRWDGSLASHQVSGRRFPGQHPLPEWLQGQPCVHTRTWTQDTPAPRLPASRPGGRSQDGEAPTSRRD